MTTKIEWATETWNPITGCTKISDGCKNCYAERMAKRLAGRYGYPKDDPFMVTFHPDKIDLPLKWQKPRMIFLCSMSDLLHDDVSPEWIDEIFDIIEICDRHIYILLTKRPENYEEKVLAFYHNVDNHIWANERRLMDYKLPDHVWLGVTAENRQCYDERWAILQTIQAKIKLVSVEPMLNRISIINFLEKPDWVIVGCESGPKRRPCKIEWMIDLVEQCKNAGVAPFVKQVNIDGKVEHDINNFPKELQYREYPK